VLVARAGDVQAGSGPASAPATGLPAVAPEGEAHEAVTQMAVGRETSGWMERAMDDGAPKPWSVPTSAVRQATALRRGRAGLEGLGIGMLVGLAAGIGLGYALGDPTGGECGGCLRPIDEAIGGAVGLVGGALVGAVVGAVIGDRTTIRF